MHMLNHKRIHNPLYLSAHRRYWLSYT